MTSLFQTITPEHMIADGLRSLKKSFQATASNIKNSIKNAFKTAADYPRDYALLAKHSKTYMGYNAYRKMRAQNTTMNAIYKSSYTREHFQKLEENMPIDKLSKQYKSGIQLAHTLSRLMIAGISEPSIDPRTNSKIRHKLIKHIEYARTHGIPHDVPSEIVESVGLQSDHQDVNYRTSRFLPTLRYD